MGDDFLKEELSIIDILDMMIRHWWILLVTALVFGMVTFVYLEVFVDPLYSTDGTLYVNAQREQSSNVSASGMQASQELVITYKEILTRRTAFDQLVTLEGEIITQVPANSMAVGRVALPSYFNERFSTVEEVYAAIIISELTHGEGHQDISLADYYTFYPVYKIGFTYYLQFAIFNNLDVAVDPPKIDLILFENQSSTPPTQQSPQL
jgi:hypothetical protein